MSLSITGENLKIEDVVDVARNNKKVTLSIESIKKINNCRDLVENKIKSGEIMYGINTGIGEFSETILSKDQIAIFERLSKRKKMIGKRN